MSQQYRDSSLNEARTRYILIDPALTKAGWNLEDRTQVGLEIPVDGYDAEPWNGVTDYCFYAPGGEVIAVVEAKRCSRNPREADEQLRHYVQHAIKSGWIRDEGFAIHRRHEEARRAAADRWNQIDSAFQYAPPEDPQQYCKILAESFPSLRNSLAHGSNSFYPTVLATFQITADLINQLFASNHCSP
jgi:hypothetical protein